MRHQRNTQYGARQSWRAGGNVLGKGTLADLRLPLDAEGWLIAANRRHLGALAASTGDEEEAECCFREGMKHYPSPDVGLLCWRRFAWLFSLRLLVYLPRIDNLANLGIMPILLKKPIRLLDRQDFLA